MRDRLRQRLPQATETQIDVMAEIVEKYDLQLTIRNLDRHGLLLIDDLDKTVRICFGEYHNRTIYIAPPETDVAIVVTDNMVMGWLRSEKLEILSSQAVVNTRFLNPMPERFVFTESCSHLEDHGGFYDGEFWECAGCGRKLL